MIVKDNGLDLILFIVNKQKSVDLETIQAPFFHQLGNKSQMSVSLFLVGWLGCVHHGGTVWVGRLTAVFDFVLGWVSWLVLRAEVMCQRSLILSEMWLRKIFSGTSPRVKCRSWLFVDRFRTVFGVEIGSEKLLGESLWLIEKKLF